MILLQFVVSVCFVLFLLDTVISLVTLPRDLWRISRERRARQRRAIAARLDAIRQS